MHWLIRRVEVSLPIPPQRVTILLFQVIRGTFPLNVQVAPAFNYARDKHDTYLLPDHSVPGCLDHPTTPHNKALFVSENLSLDFRYISESVVDGVPVPPLDLQLLDLTKKGHLGLSASINLNLEEGQVVTFILRHLSPSQVKRDLESRTPVSGKGHHFAKVPPNPKIAEELGIDYKSLVSGASKFRPADDPLLTPELLSELFTVSISANAHISLIPFSIQTTNQYWVSWIRRSTYTGSWKEAVNRSALALKLLIYEPTGAVVASPTFSLPEFIGGERNWDYRASWIRDSSFTLYALIRLGYTYEANGTLSFLTFLPLELNRSQPTWILSLNASSARTLTARYRSCIPFTVGMLTTEPTSPQCLTQASGEKIFPEEELLHLDGHKGSRPVRSVAALSPPRTPWHVPVFLAADFPESHTNSNRTPRIGNGAIDHIQLVIFLSWSSQVPPSLLNPFRISTVNCKSRLMNPLRCVCPPSSLTPIYLFTLDPTPDFFSTRMDCIYLGQKFGKPLVR